MDKKYTYTKLFKLGLRQICFCDCCMKVFYGIVVDGLLKYVLVCEWV